MKRLYLIAVLAIFAVSHGMATDVMAEPYMGFSTWPPDMTLEARDRVYTFLEKEGNITLQHFDNGVPWNEALHGRAYPAAVMNEWRDRKTLTPKGHRLVVAINPLNTGRDGLAPYWSNIGDNQPLPEYWAGKTLNDPEVMEAYANYALAVAEYFRPDYLAISIECNVLISKDMNKVEPFAYLHAHTYEKVKAKYPDMKVFTTIQYEHLRGIDDDAKPHLHYQKPVLEALLPYTDLIGISTYKFGPLHPNEMTSTYFDEALSFGKPLAITESGAISHGFHAYGINFTGSEDGQARFVEMVLEKAHKHHFEFVINWAAIDYNKLVAKLPEESRDLAKFWMYTGLEKGNGKKKQALGVWRSYMNR